MARVEVSSSFPVHFSLPPLLWVRVPDSHVGDGCFFESVRNDPSFPGSFDFPSWWSGSFSSGACYESVSANDRPRFPSFLAFPRIAGHCGLLSFPRARCALSVPSCAGPAAPTSSDSFGKTGFPYLAGAGGGVFSECSWWSLPLRRGLLFTCASWSPPTTALSRMLGVSSPLGSCLPSAVCSTLPQNMLLFQVECLF